MGEAGFKLTAVDVAVGLSYLALVAAVGVWVGRRKGEARNFYLAGRSMPVWVVAMSILATETSALTFVGVPGEAYNNLWVYLQLALGMVVGRILAATFFLGLFYKLDAVSIYQLVEWRLGRSSRRVTSGMFLFAQLLGCGVRLYAIAAVLAIAAGINVHLCIVLIAAIAFAYTIYGGMRSIIWTDVLQFVIMVGAPILCLFLLLGDPAVGGLSGLFDAAGERAASGRPFLFDFGFDISSARGFWAGIIGGMFLTCATHGTDMLNVQRALTCRGARSGRRAMIASGLMLIPMDALFLTIGVALFAFYRHSVDPGFLALEPKDIFPYFIVTELPSGVRGLLIAGVFAAAMSSLDSGMGALSASALEDHVKPALRRPLTDRGELLLNRVATAAAGILLIAVAFSCVGLRNILHVGLSVFSMTHGQLLGVFLLAALTRRGNDTGTLFAILCGTLVSAVLLNFSICQKFGMTVRVAWPWLFPIGAATTFLVGLMFRASSGGRASGGGTEG